MVDTCAGPARARPRPGLVVHLLGLFALFGVVQRERPRLAFAGLALSSAGLMLTSAIIGVLVFAGSAVGRLYTAGRTEVMDVMKEIGSPLFGISLLTEALMVAAGGVLLSMALWRRRDVPRWAVVALAISPFLFQTPLPGYPAELGGSALLAVVGLTLLRR